MTAPSALRVAEGAGAFPSCDQVKAIYTMKVASSSQGHIDKNHLHKFLQPVEFHILLTYMSMDCGRRPQYPVMNPSSHGENVQSHNLTKNLYF